VTLEAQAQGYGDNTIVWRPQGVPTAAPALDTTYTVTVSNVVVSSQARLFAYQVTVIDPDAPILAVRRTATNYVVVAWPATNTGYTLQQNTSPSDPAGWRNVTGTPQSVNGEYRIVVAASGARQAFRLRK